MRVDPNWLLTIRLEFLEVSGLDVPARQWVVPEAAPTEEEAYLLELEAINPESMLPDVPDELIPRDLSAYCLQHKDWYEWEEGIRTRASYSTHERTMARMMDTLNLSKAELYAEEPTEVQVRIGSAYRSIVYPVSRMTPVCYDCKRPLDLYFISLKDTEGWPAGWCPEHMCHSHWRREWTSVHAQDLREKDKRGQKIGETRDEYLKSQAGLLVSSWGQSQRDWWYHQKDLQSQHYSQWREKALSKLTSRFPPAP